jgi:hypothetical protein
VDRELGPAYVPSIDRGVCWSRDVSKSYVAKLGLEMTRGGAKGSPFGFAERAADGYALARKLTDESEREQNFRAASASRSRWIEYEEATKGCRAIELDERACELAEQGARVRITVAAQRESAALGASWDVPVCRDTLLALREVERRVSRAAFWEALRIVEHAHAPDEGARLLDGWIHAQLCSAAA